MNRVRKESGQAILVTVVFMTALLGTVALVVDVGSWFRTQRGLQATADAAALAAAQALPDSPGTAGALASEFVTKNGGGTAVVTFATRLRPNDTVRVRLSTNASGVFAKIFSVDSVEIGARAAARAAIPGSARWAAPIAVDERHPLISGVGCPCFNEPTELDLLKIGPGAFRLVNVDGSHGGTGPDTLGDWIRTGFSGYMPVDWYFSDSGVKFNSSQVVSALDDRIGDVLLFPVYRETVAEGANFDYHVVGWVGFRLQSYQIQGSKKNKLFGQFETIIWEGIQSESADDPDYGVRTIALVE